MRHRPGEKFREAARALLMLILAFALIAGLPAISPECLSSYAAVSSTASSGASAPQAFSDPSSEEDAVRAEADRLLTDEDYRTRRGEELKASLISPKQFEEELQRALTEHKNRYEVVIKDTDTTEFRKQYIIRFSDKTFRQVIASGNKKTLMKDFPGLFIKKAYNKAVKKEKLN